MARFADLGEQGFIDLVAGLSRPLSPRPVVGIGDDAAVLSLPPRARAVLTTDLLAEGIHFRTGTTPARLLGRKALSVNLSDIAAMGGAPHSCVVSIGFPRGTPIAYARELARGLVSQARRYGVAIAGGDTSAARSLFLSVALVGVVEPGRQVGRGGARPGEVLFVTGTLGGSAAGLKLLRAGVRRSGAPRGRGPGAAARLRRHTARLIRRHLDPIPRVLAGRALGLSGLATAMIDLSDGLARDLSRLCRASRAGAVIEAAAIPVDRSARAVLGRRRALRLALAGGEDYELLFAARSEHAPLVRRLSRRLGVPMSRIGQILPARHGIRVLRTDGRYAALPRGGFEHFPR
ncbi:MAG: thiamine-phosphate kinase [Acidobacteriota bacterium]